MPNALAEFLDSDLILLGEATSIIFGLTLAATKQGLDQQDTVLVVDQVALEGASFSPRLQGVELPAVRRGNGADEGQGGDDIRTAADVEGTAQFSLGGGLCEGNAPGITLNEKARGIVVFFRVVGEGSAGQLGPLCQAPVAQQVDLVEASAFHVVLVELDVVVFYFQVVGNGAVEDDDAPAVQGVEPHLAFEFFGPFQNRLGGGTGDLGQIESARQEAVVAMFAEGLA